MYGKVFKKFRKDKGFTIQEVADDYVSRTAISRFERDEAELSFSKVLHILEQIGVSLVEFNLSLEIGPSNDQGRIARMMVEKNLAGLEEEIQKRVEVQQHSSNKQRQLVLIMLKHQYNELSQTDKFPLDIVQVSLLTDYLFACENWAYFELVLFGNTIALYETKTVLLFSEELIKRTVYFQQERTYFETFLNILQNAAFFLLEKRAFDQVEKMLTFFESCQLDDTFLFEKLYFLYLQGLFEVMRGNAEGEMKIQEVLSVLEILDAPFVEANLREYAQMMIKK